MAKKFFSGLGLIFSIYLLLPGPQLPPPDLSNSVKSDLPGDTVQIENTAGYFTNQSRKEAINFYQDYFSRSQFLNIPLPTYRINHPPELAKQVWVDTKRSYYLEEFIHPFRESLFINGFDWQNDVFTKPEKRVKNKLIYQGQEWAVKVSPRWFPSSPIVRLTVFWLTWIAFYKLFNLWSSEVKELINTIKKR
jgi:hypothetical protein